MKVRNMTSASGNNVPNQFIISNGDVEFFQSYNTVIARRIPAKGGEMDITLDRDKWDHSKTTGKYRNLFLGETKKETERKIKAGIYKLANLN